MLQTLVFSAYVKPIGSLSNDTFPIRFTHFDGQATKGTRRMPWHQEAMKGVVSCDKLREAASKRRSGDSRMGQPNQSYVWLFLD